MIRHGRKIAFSAVVNPQRLTLTALVIVISGASASPQASANAVTPTQAWATIVTGDSSHNSGTISDRTGNGKHNKSSATVLSPTINNGVQQVSNTNVSGSTNTQVAFCKKKARICKIHQKLWVDHW
jgi:hypothetical protein